MTKPEELIKWTVVSELTTGEPTSVRKGKIPVKLPEMEKEFIKDLVNSVRKIIVKHGK